MVAMKTLALFFSSALAAESSTCSVRHDTAMSAQFYSNTKISQSECCDLCGSDKRCRTAVYSPTGECHLHDADDSHLPFAIGGWMLMSVNPAPKGQNIVELAQATPDLSTLVTALTAADLTGTLAGIGPFTVFAPTNEAFAKIDTKALTDLLANKKELVKVLEYHVLAANFSMRELMAVKIASTIEGETVKVSDGATITVGNANVLQADVLATNGFVHIIDSVLNVPSLPPLPLCCLNIVELAESQPDLSTLVAALVAGKLTDTLSGTGPFTVFAPTNEAFAKIPAADLQKLLANIKELDTVLEYHVLSGTFKMQELMAAKSIATLEGAEVTISAKGSVIKVNDAQVVTADVAATNGIVHLIDTVLSVPTEIVV